MSAKDYTTGIKVDPNNRYTVAISSVTVNDLGINESAYIYWDEGVGNFNGDYEFLLDIKTIGGSSTGAYGYGWVVANEISDMNAIQQTTPQGSHGLYGKESFSGTQDIVIIEGTTGGSTYIDFFRGGGNVQFYTKIIRDESIGANGTLYCYVYTDSARTVLVDTLSLALHEKIDFQYLYGANSDNTGGSEVYDAIFANLEFITPTPSVDIISKIAGIFGLGRLGLR